jgi:uncharacterized protein YdiU (UPF0061 family)
MLFRFENTYAKLPQRFFARVMPTPVKSPATLRMNEDVARLLRLDPADLAGASAAETLSGNRVPDGAEPIALAYAGHQFGGFVPQLGDGRAILLGEVVGADGRRYDVQLKGAGRTPYSRGGDGRAALGPVLREYLLSGAMTALGIPTTQALAAVATGEPVLREQMLQGAVLTRVAASHLRVGTFQYFAAREDVEALRTLTDYALERHYPDAFAAARREGGERPPIALLRSVMQAQASLVARWMGVGFVHGVMNTDNTSISGETIDYGPCAFLDTYHPGRTFSSIDRGGRYAFANQPRIALWNMARLAEALLPLVSDSEDEAVETLSKLLEGFQDAFNGAYRAVFRRKLGLAAERESDPELVAALLEVMAERKMDYTRTFRVLANVVDATSGARALDALGAPAGLDTVFEQILERRAAEGADGASARAQMRANNPAIIARNHLVEQMIAAAEAGDLAPLARLEAALQRPFEDHDDSPDLLALPGEEQWQYRTFCGT